MNETIAKLTPHLPIEELHLEDAVATAKAVKHDLEAALESALDRRHKPRQRKARIAVPIAATVLLVAALVAMKIRRSREASGAAQAPMPWADDATHEGLRAAGA